VWLVVVPLVAAVACGSDDTDDEDRLSVDASVEFAEEAEPVALAEGLDGGLLVGERRTGVVRRVRADESLSDPVVRVDVAGAADDQRGLLGLVSDGEQLYASWTRAADGRLVVAELTGGIERLVWEGPTSSDRANGGHLSLLTDGRLVIGVGDLLEPDLVDDPAAPNGKILALDPGGSADQIPAVLSGGWNNPYAFVVTRDGALWVADNAPGDSPERLGRGDRPRERAELPGRRAPAALVELADGRLGLCGYLDGDLVPIEIDPRNPRAAPDVGEPIASGCNTGALRLRDGRIAVSDGETVRTLVAG